MNFIEHVNQELELLKKASNGGYRKTQDVRNLSLRLFKGLDHHDITDTFSLAESLLETDIWAHKIIAFDFAHRMKSKYTINTYEVFERWLFKYIKDWWDCDDFCTHAFGELFIKYPELIHRAYSWATHENFAVRRALPVVLILPIKRNHDQNFDLFKISDMLIEDPHDLVQKGYGWMLKVYAQKNPDAVMKYLEIKHHIMPRVAFRYALEKLDAKDKKYLMSL